MTTTATSIRWAAICALVLAGCAPEVPTLGGRYTPRDSPPPRMEPPPAPPPVAEPPPEEEPSVPTLPDVARPNLVGGAIVELASGAFVAADPDRDRLHVIDEGLRTLRSIPLPEGSQPWRMVEDGAGRVHVVLRGAGTLWSGSPDDAEAEQPTLRPVCPSARGLAYDDERDHLIVACASGQLFTVAPADGPAELATTLESDLRDVVVQEDGLYVSRFRTAEVLVLDRDTFEVLDAILPATRYDDGYPRAESDPAPSPGPSDFYTPVVALSMVPHPEGGVLLLHQRAFGGPDSLPDKRSFQRERLQQPYYGNRAVLVTTTETELPCDAGLEETTVSHLQRDMTPVAGPILNRTVVAVGGAVVPESNGVLVATAVHDADPALDLVRLARFAYDAVDASEGMFCEEPELEFDHPEGDVGPLLAVLQRDNGDVVAIERNDLVVSRWNGAGDAIATFAPEVADVGDSDARRLFHQAGTSYLACASCHPEGDDDGHVWPLVGTGPRRTQSLRGGLLDTVPFHWDGRANFPQVMQIARFRMGFTETQHDQTLVEWLDTLPADEVTVADADAATRGEAYFQNDGGCTGCHSGPTLTDNQNHTVRSGLSAQTPSLRGVVFRAPYFHDGCAQTLEQVLDHSCQTENRHLAMPEVGSPEHADLLAYLRSL